MKLMLYLLALFIILSTFSYALDCQYTEKVYNGTRTYSVLLLNGIVQENFLDVQNWKCNQYWPGPGCYNSFEVHNSLDIPVNVTVKFLSVAGTVMLPINELSAHNFVTVGGPTTTEYQNIDKNSIEYIFGNNNFSNGEWRTEKVYVDKCKECPPNSGLICINDGQPSDSDDRCGSEKPRINGSCQSEYICGDNICSSDFFNENCANCPQDCSCGANGKCDAGKCINDCSHPPAGKDCCNGEFRDIKAKDKGLSCGCSFECKDHLTCRSTSCVDDCSNPPDNMSCCNGAFKNLQSLTLGNNCNCDFECKDKEGVCLNEKCQYILSPTLTCKSGTEVRKGDELYCNLVVRNTVLNSDVKATLILDAGNGLAFTASDGCQKIIGSQCIGSFMISDLSNEGVEVKLQALAGGDTKISGVVTFPYKNKTITESVPDLGVNVSICGDGKVNLGETKETCCMDTGVDANNFFNFANERCEDNIFTKPINWLFIISLFGILLIFGVLILILSTNREKEIQKKEYAKQKTLQMRMEHDVKKLHLKNAELESVKKEIEEIKISRTLEETEVNRLNKLKKEKDILLEEIENIEQTIDDKWANLKPFPDPQANNRLVIINPYLGGYKCFYNKELELKEYPISKLVHRWVWKKHTGNWPKSGYHIHHIDEDKYNNDIRNLEEIEGEEHFEKHRGR